MTLSACAADVHVELPTEVLPAQIIYRSVLCQMSQTTPDVQWIVSDSDYHDLLARIIPRHPGSPAGDPPRVDFATQHALLVSMGQKPTAGYTLDLLQVERIQTESRLSLAMTWLEPPPDAFLAQVITHPCVIIKITGEPLDSIVVTDQLGRVRISRTMKR
jgi:hypothetical protein